MNSEFTELVHQLCSLPRENEWVEFKTNNCYGKTIGEYISALSNSASILGQPYGYLVYSIKDGTHDIVGTKFQPWKEKIKGQELENWTATQLNPPIDFEIEEAEVDSKRVVIFKIEATKNTPVEFHGEAFVRVGSYKKKLKEGDPNNKSRKYAKYVPFWA